MNPNIERKKITTLEDVKNAIKQAFVGNTIILKTGDETIVPTLQKELEDLVIESVDRFDFQAKLEFYVDSLRNRFRDMTDPNIMYIITVISDAISPDRAGGIIQQYFKNKKT